MKRSLILCLFLCLSLWMRGQTTKTVGTTGADYATLKLAFADINGGTLTGAITLQVIDNTNETATAVINASGSGSASYTSILIQPSGGASRTIAGAIIAGSPLIDLNGADNVTIDGLNSGGNALILENTTASGTSGTSTIRFIGGATGNTITRCAVKGAFSAAVGTNGGNIFFSTDGTTASGNDNNTISYCDIGPSGSNLPTKAIYGNGSTTTTAIGNSGIVIDNNNIFDFFSAAVSSAGIYTAGGCNTWTITNNKFYQTGTRTWTTGAQHSPIWITPNTTTSGAQGFTITGNTIGYASNAQTGTYTLTGSTGKFTGIYYYGITSGASTSISSNTIAAVSLTGVTSSGTTTGTPFGLIVIQGGPVTSSSNTIGSQSSTGSLTFSTTTTSATDIYGILNYSSDNWTASSNNIGGITANNAGSSGPFIFYGLRANAASSYTFTAASNNIGGTIAGSIQSNSTSTSAQMIGIKTDAPSATLTSNTVRNLTAAGGTGSGSSASVIGIMVNATSANHTVTQSLVHTLGNTNSSTAVCVTGIYFAGSSSGNVIRNFVHSLSISSTSSSAVMTGIYCGSGTTSYANNMVRLGIDAGGNSLIKPTTIYGIWDALGTNSYYHNSVYIGGTGVDPTSYTYALNAQNYGTKSDNILVNNRSYSSAGSAYNCAYYLPTSVSGITTDYNIVNATGTGGVPVRYNGVNYSNMVALREVTTRDLNSCIGDPGFVNATGNSSAVDLHLTGTTPAETYGGTSSVTVDYDGETRSGLTPIDIGADAGNFTASDLFYPYITYTAIANQAVAPNLPLPGFATISDNGTGVNVTPGTLPRIYYKKITDANTFAGNTSTDQGWKWVEASNSSSPFNFTIDYSILYNSAGGAGSVVAGNVIQYFVVAQDQATTPNLTVKPVTGSAGTTVANITTAPTSPGSYAITGAIGGTYIIGTSSDAYFPTLTGTGGLFDAINNATSISGNITATIKSDITEPGTIALNQWTGSNTLTIQPDQTSAVLRTLSSSSVASSTPMIKINGADNVTIDGNISGTGKYLTFRNTNATAANTGPTIQFTNGSTGCILRNCTLENNGTAGFNFAVVEVASTGTNNITVSSNDIRDATSGTTGNPYCGIYGENSGTNTVTVTNNNIYNFSNYGVYLYGAASGCIITGNNIYNVTPQSVTQYGINVGGGDGHTVSNNNIGGQAPGCAGSAWPNTGGSLTGIYLNLGTTNATILNNNNISNINMSGAGSNTFTGIQVNTGKVNVGASGNGNTVGHATDPSKGITNAGSSTTWGINSASSSVVNIDYNTIANLNASGTGSSVSIKGINYSSLGTGTSLTNNIVNNLTTASANTSTLSSGSVVGINAQFNTGSISISKNTITNLSNTSLSGATTALGLFCGLTVSATNNIDRNIINSISLSTSGAGVITGLYASYGATCNYQNNSISLGDGITNSYAISGIIDAANGSNINNYYFNSVYIGGTAVTGSAATYAFNSNTAANSRKFQNNIFVNARSNGPGTGKHYAVKYTTGGTLTADYNDFLATGSGAVFGYYGADIADLGAWRTATGKDAHSLNVNPNFASATNLTPADGYYFPGTTISGITTDMAGTTRAAAPYRPDMGAYEKTSTSVVRWLGTTSTDWAAGTNWDKTDATVPSSSDNLWIPTWGNNLTVHVTTPIASFATCNKLTIYSGTSLTIDAGKALTVTGTLTNNASPGVIIRSDATGSGSLIFNAPSVTGTMDRYISHWTDDNHGWHFLSSPVTGHSPILCHPRRITWRISTHGTR